MFLADTLSPAPVPDVVDCEFVHELENINHQEHLPVSRERWRQIKHAAKDDPVMAKLCTVIQGWPENVSFRKSPECLIPYYDMRDELTVQDILVFKGHQLVVVLCLQKEMMEAIHASHIGVEGCIR